MPKPKTSPDLTPKPYRLLKTDLATKLSPRSQGGITYVLLAEDSDTPDLYLAVTGNEGGGLWSKEAVRLDTIEEVLDAYGDQPFPTRALQSAMVGRSSNNPPFCLAVLKDLGLVAPAPDKAHQHVKAGDWAAFRAEWLAKPGETIMYPEPKADDPQTGEAPAEAGPIDKAPPAVAKGKKRKKSPADVSSVALPENEVVEAAVADVHDLPADEADHAPTAHS